MPTPHPPQKTANALISAAELEAGLAADRASATSTPRYLVFDVRHQLNDTTWGRQCYAQAHIAQAHFLHLDDDLSGTKTGRNGRHPLPEVATFIQCLNRHGLQAQHHVVVYDQNNGTMAARLWWMLKFWLGHAAVSVLDGGWDAWLRAGYPVESGAQTRPVASALPSYQACIQAQSSVGVEDLLGPLQHKTTPAPWRIVDARAPERFAGSVEPLDPVAGHIPGARNHPFTHNVDGLGCFLSQAQLRAHWLEFLGDTPAQAVVHQCGSGVTACHNLLAMEHAGLEGSRLYPGSWSEWCSDPARPVERG